MYKYQLAAYNNGTLNFNSDIQIINLINHFISLIIKKKNKIKIYILEFINEYQ